MASSPAADPKSRSVFSPVMRGVLFAVVALGAVSLFIRVEFPPAAASPAWTPKEAAKVPVAAPVESVRPSVEPEPTPEPAPAQKTVAKQAPRPRIIVVTPDTPVAYAKPTSKDTANSPEPSRAETREVVVPVAKTAAAEPAPELDAPPPPPGVAASGRKPEQDKPLPKRLFRAVGKMFKGKKTTEENNIQPSEHHPKQT